MSGTEEPTMTTRCSVCLTFCPLSPLSKYTTPNPPLPNSPPIEYLVFDMVLKSVSTPVVHSAVTTVVSMTSRIFWMLNCERCQLSVLRQRRPLASIATLTSLVLPSLSVAVSKASVPRHSTGIAHDTVTHPSTRFSSFFNCPEHTCRVLFTLVPFDGVLFLLCC